MKVYELIRALQKASVGGYSESEVRVCDYEGKTKDLVEVRQEDLAGLVLLEYES